MRGRRRRYHRPRRCGRRLRLGERQDGRRGRLPGGGGHRSETRQVRAHRDRLHGRLRGNRRVRPLRHHLDGGHRRKPRDAPPPHQRTVSRSGLATSGPFRASSGPPRATSAGSPAANEPKRRIWARKPSMGTPRPQTPAAGCEGILHLPRKSGSKALFRFFGALAISDTVQYRTVFDTMKTYYETPGCAPSTFCAARARMQRRKR